MCPSHSAFCFVTRPPPASTFFPYTTLFRSQHLLVEVADHLVVDLHAQPHGRRLERRLDRADGVAEPAQVDLARSEEHTSELQSRRELVCRLLLEKKKSENRRHDVGCRGLAA